MKDEQTKRSAKRKYVEVKVEKIDFSEEDIITYSWDDNVPEDGWQFF